MSNRLDGDQLDGVTTETFEDSEGNKTLWVGGELVQGTVTGRTRAERSAMNAQENTPTEDDGSGYHDRRSGEDGDETNSEMVALFESGLIDEKDMQEISTNPRRYNAEFDALRDRIAAQRGDAPRLNTVAKLRTELQELDEASGGRRTARREELVNRIARFHGGGR